jgi:antitoxin component YwqK of YwqJK toxin-antitoxin module
MIIDKDQKGTITGLNFHNGPLLQWHDNGQLSVSGNHEDGQRQGTWTYWNKDGQIEMLRTYQNDSLINEVKPLMNQ